MWRVLLVMSVECSPRVS